MREGEELERLLDSALSTYGIAERGLEGRVLRAVRQERSARAAQEQPRGLRSWRLWWAIALPLGACGLMLVVLMMRGGRTQETVRVEQPSEPHGTRSAAPHRAEPVAIIPEEKRDHRRRAAPVHSVPAVATLPKEEVFPTPQPLSAEEQLLVAAVSRGATERQNLLAASKPPPDAPLAIAGLSIAPLASLGDGKN